MQITCSSRGTKAYDALFLQFEFQINSAVPDGLRRSWNESDHTSDVQGTLSGTIIPLAFVSAPKATCGGWACQQMSLGSLTQTVIYTDKQKSAYAFFDPTIWLFYVTTLSQKYKPPETILSQDIYSTNNYSIQKNIFTTSTALLLTYIVH